MRGNWSIPIYRYIMSHRNNSQRIHLREADDNNLLMSRRQVSNISPATIYIPSHPNVQNWSVIFQLSFYFMFSDSATQIADNYAISLVSTIINSHFCIDHKQAHSSCTRIAIHRSRALGAIINRF